LLDEATDAVDWQPLKKSGKNAMHDGKIIKCPIETAQPGYIYQMNLNNSVDQTSLVMDIRAFVFGNTISFVRLTYKKKEYRFEGNFVDAKIVVPDAVFSVEELALILKLCNRMGLDYGELDIIRNRDNDRIYVLDVNNTPSRSFHPYWGFDNNLNSAICFSEAFL